MTPAELVIVLRDFYHETLDLFRTRLGNARSVSAYDANNGYQQVLGRQEEHLRWLSDAIADLAGTAPNMEEEPVPGRLSHENIRSIIESDVGSQKSFIVRWSARVPSVTNARNQKMLELILGEMKEHLRILEQAKEGRSDLLGRHSDGKVLRGEVLSGRPRN